MVKAAKQDRIQLGVAGDVISAVFLVQFIQAAGIVDKIQLIPYGDAGRITIDVITGEIDGAFGEIQELKQQYNTGKIDLLLVGTKEPLDEFPDVPSAGEMG